MYSATVFDGSSTPSATRMEAIVPVNDLLTDIAA